MIKVKSKNKSYNIYIQKNILKEITNYIDFNKFSKVVILTDENVIRYNWIKNISIKAEFIVIKYGEINKTLDTINYIWQSMNNLKMDRKSLLINVGGGGVCDLGGFCASTYMRGIEFIQIPTTLLAQIDASVGGKTGFDFNGGKNIIGTFAEPYAVIIDTATLSTLPKREYNSGMAEIIKYGIIYDKKFFHYLESKDIDINHIIEKCCKIKAKIVAIDFKENGLRKILNFGHTIGHSIESISLKTQNPLLHGEAVAIGIMAISYIANKIRKITNVELKQIKNILLLYNLPISYNCNLDDVYLGLFKDKKTIKNKIKFILPKGIGKCDIDIEVEENIIEEGIKNILI